VSNVAAATVPRRSRSLRLFTSLALVALAGAAAGSVASYSYYHDLLRPLAHLISPWILFAAAVSARRSAVHAMLGSVVGLVCGVLAFFVGRQVIYSIRYSGSPYEINTRLSRCGASSRSSAAPTSVLPSIVWAAEGG
jgi:hypothetical protein